VCNTTFLLQFLTAGVGSKNEIHLDRGSSKQAGMLGGQTCQAAWWTDLPSPLASAIRHLSHLDHQLKTEGNANKTNLNK
jgi:hypothetical protein